MRRLILTHSLNRVGNTPRFVFQISNLKENNHGPLGTRLNKITPKRDNPHKCAPVSAANFRESIYNKARKTADVRFCVETATISGTAIHMPF